MPDLIGHLFGVAFLQVFVGEEIMILLRGKCPKAKSEVVDSQ
jgi:Leu/Phe-tRNA-protein transferase